MRSKLIAICGGLALLSIDAFAVAAGPSPPNANLPTGAGVPATPQSSTMVTSMTLPPVGVGVAAIRPTAEIGIPGSMNFGGSQLFISLLRGGSAAGTVITEQLGQDHVRRKHLGRVLWDPIVVETAPGPPLTSLVGPFLAGPVMRFNGAISDDVLPAGQELTFINSVLSEVVFPACDAQSPDHGKVRVTFVPETVRLAPHATATQVAPQSVKLGGLLGAQWSSSNFELTMGGVEAQRVARIEPITVRQVATSNAVGVDRDLQAQPAMLEISNVILTLTAANEASIAGWLNWYRDFVIVGTNRNAQKKSFTLAFLSNDRKTSLGNLTGSGVGIVSLRALPSNNSTVRLYQVELYVEQLDFK